MPLLYSLPPLGAVLIWSGNMSINQLAVTAIAPSAIVFYRWVLALAVLSPFVLPCYGVCEARFVPSCQNWLSWVC